MMGTKYITDQDPFYEIPPEHPICQEKRLKKKIEEETEAILKENKERIKQYKRRGREYRKRTKEFEERLNGSKWKHRLKLLCLEW